MSKPNLGLGLDLYKDLATNLDTVVHNGALVNHAFTYEQLFEPNVLGSLEVRAPLKRVSPRVFRNHASSPTSSCSSPTCSAPSRCSACLTLVVSCHLCALRPEVHHRYCQRSTQDFPVFAYGEMYSCNP